MLAFEIDHDVIAALIGGFAIVTVAVIPTMVRRKMPNGAREIAEILEARLELVQEQLENLSEEVDTANRRMINHVDSTAPLVEYVKTLMPKEDA